MINELGIQYEVCDTLADAISMGNTMRFDDYHILVKVKRKKKIICIVWHSPYIQCQFCSMEKKTNEPFIWL